MFEKKSIDHLFVTIVEHPELRLELGLVEDVAQPGEVGRDLGGLGHGEVVGGLQLVDAVAVGRRVALPQRHHLRLGRAVVLHEAAQLDLGLDLFRVEGAGGLQAGDALGGVEDDALGVGADAVEGDVEGNVDVPQVGPPFRDADLEEKSACGENTF